MWRSAVTAPCVYNELAGNRHVFTLDLIVSTPALLLLTVFRARLSATAGCFKVCVCVAGVGEWWYLCRSACFFGPFFLSQRLGWREGNPLSGQCTPTQTPLLIDGAIGPLFALVEALICCLVQRFSWWHPVEGFGLFMFSLKPYILEVRDEAVS